MESTRVQLTHKCIAFENNRPKPVEMIKDLSAPISTYLGRQHDSFLLCRK